MSATLQRSQKIASGPPLTQLVVRLVPEGAPSLEGVVESPPLGAGTLAILHLERIAELVEEAVSAGGRQGLPVPQVVAHYA